MAPRVGRDGAQARPESSTGTIQFQALEKLAESVKQKTNGEYSIRLFPGGQLGPVRDTMQQLKMVTLDLVGATNNSPTVMKEGKNFNTTAAPFAFRSIEEDHKFLGSRSPSKVQSDSMVLACCVEDY